MEFVSEAASREKNSNQLSLSNNMGLPSRQSSQGHPGCGLLGQKDTKVVFCGCHKKLLPTRQLKARALYSVSVLEARI